jgi:hypothetical protein
MSSAELQPVLTPLTEAAIVLVLTVPAGGEDAVCDLLPDSGDLLVDIRRTGSTSASSSPSTSPTDSPARRRWWTRSTDSRRIPM